MLVHTWMDLTVETKPRMNVLSRWKYYNWLLVSFSFSKNLQVIFIAFSFIGKLKVLIGALKPSVKAFIEFKKLRNLSTLHINSVVHEQPLNYRSFKSCSENSKISATDAENVWAASFTCWVPIAAAMNINVWSNPAILIFLLEI